MDMPLWPRASRGDVQEFFCTGGVWQTWTKPRGVDRLSIVCIGSGASGGGGLTGATGSARGGGGGGGGGNIARLEIAASLLSDLLYVQVAVGGASVGAGTLGNPGALSYISLIPATTAASLVLVSGSAASAGGSAGTTAGNNSGGAGGTAGVATNWEFATLGVFTTLAGGVGTNSGTISGANGNSGAAQTWGGSGVVCQGGTGGGTVGTGNTDFAGGQIVGIANLVPTVVGGLAAGGAGNFGFYSRNPFRTGGGTGGGSGEGGTNIGGRGGDGALGCGGGGGGGGRTGGASGRGGDGYVLIVSW